MDICGPMHTSSHSRKKYFITFINDYTHKAHIYFLSAKSKAFKKFKEFKANVENHMKRRIGILHLDNGTEYVNKSFKQFLKEHGIRHTRMTLYTSQQNGVAEWFNRMIIEMARTMMNAADLPQSFWAEALNTVVYICN